MKAIGGLLKTKTRRERAVYSDKLGKAELALESELWQSCAGL